MERRDGMIAVFDSGVGGISVLRQLVRQMPNENFLYFGDSANAPYGSRSTEEIRRLTLQNVEKLYRRGLKALVIACNTATSAAIDALRQTYPQEIIVGIEPAVKLAAERFPHGRIAVMATEATLREQKFNTLVHTYDGEEEIIPVPCPELVKFVERGETHSENLMCYLHSRLDLLLARGLDGIVLGCTHFPFVRGAIAEVAGERVALLDGGEGTARETCRRIRAANLQNPPGKGTVLLENSLSTPQMLAQMRRMLADL